jgi:hypothetical protein
VSKALADLIRANIPKTVSALLRVVDSADASPSEILKAAVELRALANELDPPEVSESNGRGPDPREVLAKLLEAHEAPCKNCCEMISTEWRYCSHCGFHNGADRSPETQLDSLKALGEVQPVEKPKLIDRLAPAAEAVTVPKKVEQQDPLEMQLAAMRKSAVQKTDSPFVGNGAHDPTRCDPRYLPPDGWSWN